MVNKDKGFNKKAILGLSMENLLWIVLFIMLFSFLAYKLLKSLIG